MLLITHPDCEHHEMPRHPERPDRLRSVMARLESSGLLSQITTELATEIEHEDIAMVHPSAYIDNVLTAEPETGIVKVDPDTYMSPGSTRAVKLAAGACARGMRAILGGESQRVFCAIRPPGHHAELAAAMGFCLFNNVAVAAEIALLDPDIDRVAICDFDVHHCNGTVDIFKDREEVLVCSSFQENFYPMRYLDFENPHIVNSPLAAGSTSDAFRHAITDSWFPAIERHKPDVILISAGFDAHSEDPLGGLELQDDDYSWITRRLLEQADEYSKGRVLSTMEGGYDLDALARAAERHVGEMAR